MPPQVTNLSGGLSPEGPPPPGERVGHGRGMDLVAVAVVISFLALGLAGISLCKLLQRRGYRCKAEAKGHGGAAGPQDDAVDGMDSEEEMIRRIARLVTENPANHNALFALQQHQQRPDTVTPAPSLLWLPLPDSACRRLPPPPRRRGAAVPGGDPGEAPRGGGPREAPPPGPREAPPPGPRGPRRWSLATPAQAWAGWGGVGSGFALRRPPDAVEGAREIGGLARGVAKTRAAGEGAKLSVGRFHVTRISEAGRRASGMMKGGPLPLSPRGPGILGGASGTREGRGDA
ncbi:uncharacterized protein LOC116955663 [Petromyzon marinus]|uniref:uncharacterized protein LOC116955663 n=1 Tax=Petromyzon marinus TaxID=7757 RepID=UPI003F730A2C